jgi:hypothetical protein
MHRVPSEPLFGSKIGFEAGAPIAQRRHHHRAPARAASLLSLRLTSSQTQSAPLSKKPCVLLSTINSPAQHAFPRAFDYD